jgi:pilus assembly protein Flp/PilA
MYLIIFNWLKSFFRKNDGQTLSEYALILVLVALAVLVVLGLLGGQIQAIFQAVIDALTPAAG